MKKLSMLLICIIIIVGLTACNTNVVKGTIVRNSDVGYAVLDIMPQKLFEIAEIGESVTVTIGDFKSEMPLVDNMIDVDGKLQLYYDYEEHSLSIVLCNQDFCEVYDIPENSKVRIEKA